MAPISVQGECSIKKSEIKYTHRPGLGPLYLHYLLQIGAQLHLDVILAKTKEFAVPR